MSTKASDTAVMRVRQGSARFSAAFGVLAFLLADPAAAQGQAGTGAGSQFELTFWQSVESGEDPALYEAYLAQYPNGTFATVARVKLLKLRQSAPPAAAPVMASVPAPVAPAPVAAAPTPAPAPALAPAPAITTAAAPQPAITQQPKVAVQAPPPAAPPPQPPTRKQLAATKTVLPAPVSAPVLAPVPAPVPASRERLAPRDSSEPAPYVTPAPPVEPAGESADSAALRRLLGALGDSQRAGAPPPAPIVEVDEAPAPEGTALAMPPAAAAAPGAAQPRLIEAAGPAAQGSAVPVAVGPPVAVPDAAALSAMRAPVSSASAIAVGPLPASFALPPRPQLVPIPPLAFPASFCSAEARNAFHDGSYIVAVEAAKRNNDSAIAYMRQLQDIYDTNQLSGDINPMNAIAAESRAYGPVAAAAFAAQSTLVSAFGTLMAVPIVPCGAPKQP